MIYSYLNRDAFLNRNARMGSHEPPSEPSEPIASTELVGTSDEHDESEPQGLPVPRTKSAVLASAGYGKKLVPTLHRYVETVPSDEGYAFIFECTQTRARRKWGSRMAWASLE